MPTTPQSVLLRARTSQGYAHLKMPPAYQGRFFVQAPQSNVTVNDLAVDPADRGRTRRVLKDEVRWVPDGADDAELGLLDIAVEDGTARVEL